jgi:hypothetical protein
MGIEFLEFPPVLQLYLRRFEYNVDYDQNEKLNDRYEFPTEIDLTTYLARDADRSRSNVYELYGVLVHSGDVSFGHYDAFLRTTTAPQWFEFNDSHVKKVTAWKAIDANFGGHEVTTTQTGWTHTGWNWDKSFSAYILVYLRRADAAQILTPLRDEEVPEHVRESINQPDEEEARMKTPGTVNVFDLDRSLRENTCASCLGFQRANCYQTLKIEETDTFSSVYDKIAALYNTKPDAIGVWYGCSGPNAIPNIQLPRMPQMPTYALKWYTFFLVHKQPGEPLVQSVTALTVYLKFFCPAWEAPLQYLGSYTTSKMVRISALLAEVNSRLGTPPETPLLIYEENLSKTVRQLKLLPSDDLDTNRAWISTGHCLIFQFQPGTPIPEMRFNPLPPISGIPEETAAAPDDVEAKQGFAEVPVHELTLTRGPCETVEQWVAQRVSTRVDIIVFAYAAPKVPLARLRIPSTAKWDDLTTLIATATKVDYVAGEDTMLLYKKDYYTDDPSSSPHTTSYYPTISMLFPSTDRSQHWLFFRVLKGITPTEVAKGTLITVEMSLDGHTVAKSVEVAVSRSAYFRELRRKLDPLDFLQGIDGDAQFVILKDSTVSDVDDNDFLSYVTRVCVTVVPRGSQGPSDAEQRVWLMLAGIDTIDYLQPVGLPVLLRGTDTLTVAQAKPEIARLLALTPDEAKKMNCFTGERLVPFVPGQALKDEALLWDLGDPATVYVVHDTKRKPNRWRQQSRLTTKPFSTYSADCRRPDRKASPSKRQKAKLKWKWLKL